jgi:hypothetical protein
MIKNYKQWRSVNESNKNSNLPKTIGELEEWAIQWLKDTGLWNEGRNNNSQSYHLRVPSENQWILDFDIEDMVSLDDYGGYYSIKISGTSIDGKIDEVKEIIGDWKTMSEYVIDLDWSPDEIDRRGWQRKSGDDPNLDVDDDVTDLLDGLFSGSSEAPEPTWEDAEVYDDFSDSWPEFEVIWKGSLDPADLFHPDQRGHEGSIYDIIVNNIPNVTVYLPDWKYDANQDSNWKMAPSYQL